MPAKPRFLLLADPDAHTFVHGDLYWVDGWPHEAICVDVQQGGMWLRPLTGWAFVKACVNYLLYSPTYLSGIWWDESIKGYHP